MKLQLPPNTTPPTPAGWGDPISKSTCRACGAPVVVALATTYRPGLSLNALRRHFFYAGELPPVTRLAFTPSPGMGTPEECARQWLRPCPGALAREVVG